MENTLLTRISKLEQYNVINKTIIWEDPTPNRWQNKNVYGGLQLNDNVIFIGREKVLIGKISQLNVRQNIHCFNVQEINCSNDQLLQLHEIYPELISRVKANFQPFIHPQQINISQIIADANAKRFINYYIIAGIDKLKKIESDLEMNDRVVLIDSSDRLLNVQLYNKSSLINFPVNREVNISVAGLTLDEILEKNASIKRESQKSNNVTRIQNIIKAIRDDGFYKFKTFFSYNDALFNKRVYFKNGNLTNSIFKIKLHKDEQVFKVSMSSKQISEDVFTYLNDHNLIIVHSDTKAKGKSNQTQGNIFTEQMKIGDYFYLCRGNSNFEIIGKITSNVEECEYNDLGQDGWLQRAYEIIADVQNDGPYQDENKWWTPNNNSTCVPIPIEQIGEANDKIFIPFFNTKFEFDINDIENPNKDKKMNQLPINQILYGPPGTGKTFNTINKALEIIGEKIDDKSREEIKSIFDTKVKDGQIVFTTFHQSMSYEDFIEGIKPETSDNEIGYEVKAGILKRFCTQAKSSEIETDNFETIYQKWLDEIKANNGKLVLESIKRSKEFTVYVNSKNNIRFHANTEKAYEGVIKKEVIEHYLKTGELLDWPSYVKAIGALPAFKNYSQKEKSIEKNFVFIIDEINRGNVSQIFGELITLIEEDKRLGREEALEVILPYSKEPFSVPANLYIIGTMNTADRSVEALDTALRRRFHFIEMPPQPELIATEGKLKENKGVLENIDLPQLLTMINKRIEKLLDKDHQIGHSYFMNVSNLEELKSAFQNKIIPLLQEYFFGDYGKIGLVLGEEFFEIEDEGKEKNIFAKFQDYDSTDFSERKVYKLKNVYEMDNVENDHTNFLKAINALMEK